MGIFNTVLGEELLFRGLLLPRMSGAVRPVGLGRQRRAVRRLPPARAVGHPAALLDTFILAYPSKRYRSALIGIAVHSAQTVVISAPRPRPGAALSTAGSPAPTPTTQGGVNP